MISSTDWVATIIWQSRCEADLISPDSLAMAKGCKPNSGSSMIIVLGSLGCKSKTVKAIKRRVPSEKL